MPALPADIAAATRPHGVALETVEDANILAIQPAARDGAQEPIAAWWDSRAAAAQLVAERFQILQKPLRRFTAKIAGLHWELFPGSAVQTIHFRDAEGAADGLFMVSRVEVDIEQEITLVELIG